MDTLNHADSPNKTSPLSQIFSKLKNGGKTGGDAEIIDARRIDYRYAQDDPFFFIKGDSVWTGVILGTTSDDFASEMEEEQQVRRNNELRSALSAHFANHFGEHLVTCHDITRHVPVDVSRWSKQYLSNLWDPSKLFQDLMKDKVSPLIAESTPERRQYLLIRLGDFKTPTQLDPLSKILGKSAGVAEEVFNSSDLDPFREKAHSVHSLLVSFGAVPMERADLAWIIRKVFYGHFPADNGVLVERTRPWRGGFFDEIARSNARVIGNHIRIDNPHPANGLGDYSHTTTVMVDFNAMEVGYQYSQAWGKMLRTLQRPVDVSWRSTVMSSKEWSKRVKKAFSRIDSELKEQVAAHAEIKESFSKKWSLAEHAAKQQEENPRPIIVSQLRLTFSAPTADELNDVLGQLQALFGDDVKVERRSDCQGFLLEEQLPGDMTPPKGRTLGFGKSIISGLTGGITGGERWTDLDALSFARLDSSPSVGDEVEYTSNGMVLGWRGGPIGYTISNGAVVHFDPIVQMARNSGAGIAILGSSGGGKSSLSLALFFWMSESGAQCIAVDPKNDFEAFIYYLSFGNQVTKEGFEEEAQAGTLGLPGSRFQPRNPTFWEDSSVVSLGAGTPGMLDPWALSDSYSEGETIARNIVEIVLGKDSLRYLDVAFQKMRDVHEKGQNTNPPSLAELASHLGQEQEYYESIASNASSDGDRMTAKRYSMEIRSVADALDRAAGRQYGRLMFARSSATRPFSIGNQRRIVLTLFGLKLPPNGVPMEEWEDSTRDAAAAMTVVINELRRIFTSSHNELSPWKQRRGSKPRILFIDEAYFLTAFKAGRTMLDLFLRQGRSRFFSCVFISQQASDLAKISEDSATGEGETSTNQFPVIFVFRQRGMDEARDAMKLLRPKFSEEGSARMLNRAAQTLLSRNDGGSLETGMAVMRDVDSRVSIVQVDRMFTELATASETNPQIRSTSQSVDVSADGSQWMLDTTTRDMLRTGVIAAEIGEIREAVDAYEYGEYAYLTGAVSG